MSCFIVKDRTIDRIATWIDNLPPDTQLKDGTAIRARFAEEFDIDASDNLFGVELAEKLRQMNVDAFIGRYEGRHMEDIGEYAYTPSPIEGQTDKNFIDAGVCKNLACYQYQCSEAPVFGTSRYKLIADLVDTLDEWVCCNYGVAEPANAKPYAAEPWG